MIHVEKVEFSMPRTIADAGLLYKIETSSDQVGIDSATYMLKINSPITI